jgi:hypothetical protein
VTASTVGVETRRSRSVDRIAAVGRWAADHGLLIIVLAGGLVGLRRAESPYADGDLLWSIRAGLDTIQHGTIPKVDTYSWTASGRTWVPNSWGWNVVLGCVYNVAGLTGIALVGIAVVIGIALLVRTAALRAGASATWTGLLFQVCAGFFAVFLYPRPHVVDYVMVLAFPLLLGPALDGTRSLRRSAAALVGLQIVWMNLHTAAVLGPAIVAVATAGQALGRRSRSVLWRGTLLTALTAGGCLATPYGVAPIEHIDDVRRASVGLISEWRPAGFSSPEQLLGVVAIVLGAFAGWLAARRLRYDTLGVLLLFTVLTASAIRFAPMLALCALPELAAGARRLPVRSMLIDRACVLALVILAVGCLAGSRGFAQPGAEYTSYRLVKALPNGCRLLNDLSVGGSVILHRPDVKVAIDSRNDLYGRGAEIESLQVLTDAQVGERYLQNHDVSCVLIPTATPLATALRTEPAWRTAGRDPVRTLFLRISA